MGRFSSNGWLGELAKVLGCIILLLNTDSVACMGQTEPEWPCEVQIDQFMIHSDFALEDLPELQEILGNLRGDIGEMLGQEKQSSKVHIVMFGSQREYSRYMAHYFPSIVPRRAIYLQDRGPGMLFTFLHDNIDTDLRHEAVHALLNQTGVPLPLWLDEGLAEYFEVPKQQRYRHNSHLHPVASRAKGGIVPSLLELERMTDMPSFNDNHYRDSWAWTHFLLHRNQHTRQLLLEYLDRHRRRIPQANLIRQLSAAMLDPSHEFQQHFIQLLDTPSQVGN